MAVVDVEFRANANFSGLISQANMANAAISKLQASVTSLNAEQINQAFSQFSKGLTGSGQYIAQTVRVSDATQRFGQDLVNNKLQLKDYAREFGRYVSGRESQIKKLADQQVRLQRSLVVSRGADATGSLVAQVFTPTGLSNDLETSAMRATSRIQVMNEFLHKASTAVVNWGKNTQWAGRQMTVGLTVPLSMLATATGKAFYELDAQLIQMQKVYGTGIKGVGDEAIASIRSQVTELSRELAKAYGIPVAQTAALAAEIAQAGKTGNELLASVEQTTKLATLGEIDRQDAMKATLSIQSTFNQNTQELSDSINFLNSVENATNLSLQDLVTGIPKAGPVVKALGGDIKDLSLMMVAMKEGGIPASEAANAIKSSLASLINPTEKVTDKMKKFGIDLVGIVDRNAGQLMPTLMEFRGELNKLDDLSRQRILEELFGKFQFARVNALFNNLGRAGSQTVQVMELMGLSTAELASIADKELKTMAESASGRFKRLWATVQGDLAVAGQGVLNAGSVILSVISKIINGFEQLPDGLKKFLGGTALLAAVIGPIIMTIGVLGNFFGYIMKGLALTRSFGRRGAGDFQLMTAETVAMANAGSILENTLFDQAKAADLMRTSIEKLTASLAEMGAVSSTAGAAATSSLSTSEGRGLGAVTAINAQTMKDIEGRKRALPEDIEVGHQISASNLASGGKKQTVRFAGSMTRENADVNQAHKNVNRYLMESSAAMDEAAATAGSSIALLKTSVKNTKKLTQKEAERLARYMNDTTLSIEQKRQFFNDFFKNPDAFDDFIKTAITETKIQRKELDKIARMSESAMKGQITKLTNARKKEMEELGVDAKEIEQVLSSINNAIDTSLEQKLFALKNLDAKLYSQATGSTGLITSSQGGKVGEPIASGPLVVGGMTGAAGGTENTLDIKTLQELQKLNQNLDENTAATKAGTATEKQGQVVDKEQIAAEKVLTTATIADASAEAMDSGVGGLGLNGLGGKPGDKPGGRGRGRGAMMAGGMALSMGSMFTSNAKIGGAMMGGGMALSMAEMIPEGAFKSIIDKSTKIKGALTGIANVGSKLRLLGPLIFNPWVAGAAAVGAAAIFLKNRLDDAAEKNRSWMASSKDDADALGFKYFDLKQKVEDIASSTDKAASATKKLVDEINKAPDTNPLGKLAGDIKDDKSTEDSINKMVNFFRLQLARGVDPKLISTQLDAVLEIAGKKELSIPLKFQLDKIDTTDAKANVQSLMESFNVGDAAQVQELAQGIQTIAGDINNMDPSKWTEITSGLNNAANATDLSTGRMMAFNDEVVKAYGLQGVWKDAAYASNSAADSFNIAALALANIIPAADAAGRAMQVAFNQQLNLDISKQASSAVGGIIAASPKAKKASTPSSGGGGGSKDPYKAQKDANDKRIDQEKDIIKAIEKKRSAEKKAFDEKKRQNEFLNKQADLQIGYREALASGDFAAAALVKNQMLNEQRQKSLEDAQASKDDSYQEQIDRHQSIIDKAEDANKKLQAMSQKAMSTAVSSSGAVATQTKINATEVESLYATVLTNGKTQHYTSMADMMTQNGTVVTQLETMGVNTKAFFTAAYADYQVNINDAISSLGASSRQLALEIVKQGGVVNDLISLQGLTGEAFTNAANKILADLKSKTKADASAGDQVIPVFSTRPNQPGGFQDSGGLSAPNLSFNTNASHSGGLLDKEGVYNRNGRSKSQGLYSDEIPIIAQRGEYMINANAAKKIGVDKLNMMNSGELPKYHTGGLIEGQGAGPNEIAPESSYIKYIYGPKNKPKTAPKPKTDPKPSPKTPTVQQKRAAAPTGTGTNDSSSNSTAARYGNIRPVNSAVSYLEGQIKNGTDAWRRLCERLARTAYGLDGHFATAKKHFNAIPASQRKNLSPASAKKGMLGFWDTGSAGHIAVADGSGSFYTNLSNGKVGKLKASTINTWGPKLGVTNPYWGPGQWIDVVSGNRAGFDSRRNPTLSGPQGRRGRIATVHTGGPIEKLQSDEVQRVLQTGEYVINRNAARSIGRANLESLNSGKQLANTSNSNYNIVVNPSIGMNENDLAEKVIGKIKLMDKRKGGVR